MRSFRLKGIWMLLFVVLIALCSTFDVCEGRRGKHWRTNRAPYTSLAKKKSKGKAAGGGSGRHRSGSGSNTRPSPPSSPSPTPPSNPSPVSRPGVVFDVVEYGAKGDGCTDDTKVAYIVLSDASNWF